MRTTSIQSFRNQSKSAFSHVVRSQLGASMFMRDPELCNRHPGLYRVAKQTVAAPVVARKEMPALLRKVSEGEQQKQKWTPEQTVGWAFVFLLLLFCFFVPRVSSAQSWATPYGGSTYEPRGEARSVKQVTYATVMDVRETFLKEEGTSYVGTGIGGTLGALLGSKVGSGNGTYAAQAALGLIGGALGNRLANQTRDGLEVVIKMDDGRTVAIVQEKDGLTFTPGDRVRVIAGNQTRVVPAPEASTVKTASNSTAESDAKMVQALRQQIENEMRAKYQK